MDNLIANFIYINVNWSAKKQEDGKALKGLKGLVSEDFYSF